MIVKHEVSNGNYVAEYLHVREFDPEMKHATVDNRPALGCLMLHDRVMLAKLEVPEWSLGRSVTYKIVGLAHVELPSHTLVISCTSGSCGSCGNDARWLILSRAGGQGWFSQMRCSWCRRTQNGR